MTLTLRSVKGSNLTAEEFDGNTEELDDRISTLEETPPDAPYLSNVTQADSLVEFHRSDGTKFAVTLPAARGELTVAAITAATHTVTVADSGKYNRCSHASGCAVSILPNAEQAIDVGFECYFRQVADAPVVLEFDSDLTVNEIEGFEVATGRRGTVIGIKKVGDDEWDVNGYPALMESL